MRPAKTGVILNLKHKLQKMTKKRKYPSVCLHACMCIPNYSIYFLPESMFSSCVQFTQLGQSHLAEWSRPVGGPVYSVIVH